MTADSPKHAELSEAARNVLLAEDDADLRALLATMLRRAGFVVQEFSTGTQLLRVLQQDGEPVAPTAEIGLVISDIRMPGASGLDVLARLMGAKRTVPVVLMTAFGDSMTHARALTLGAAATLDKPFELDDLLSLANRLLPH